VAIDGRFGYAEVMMVVVVGVDGGFGQAGLPAFALTDEEYQGCITSLQASLTSY
jgi:hypothetical protein